jgi:glycosyltransferase involved in cell wall biosynthesis
VAKPLISVVIPGYNAAAWVRQCLQSAIAQRDLELEILFVDDGSTDDTAAIVAREFPSVQLIRTGNLGASRARNTGTQAAVGAFIQYLDSDDILAAGKIVAQVRALQRTGADVAYGDWQRIDSDGSGEFTAAEIVARQIHRAPELELLGEFWCPPAAYLFRREIVDRVGGWNEGLPIIQDARFALDCALHGGVFTYCPGIMAYYRQHGQGSLSHRDPLAFDRDVHRNACEVEQWWRSRGELHQDRIEALVECYGYVTRATYERDHPTFEQAYADLQRLAPGYVPRQPLRMTIASRLIGYRKAEAAASIFRKAKRILKAQQA